jgi:hypothetical protein
MKIVISGTTASYGRFGVSTSSGTTTTDRPKGAGKRIARGRPPGHCHPTP